MTKANISGDTTARILQQLSVEMGVPLDTEWAQSMRNLRKRILEQALDDAIKRHGWTVSPEERKRFLNQLDADLFP
jgi:hypothetical protein